jgi:hypothetical protein
MTGVSGGKSAAHDSTDSGSFLTAPGMIDGSSAKCSARLTSRSMKLSPFLRISSSSCGLMVSFTVRSLVVWMKIAIQLFTFAIFRANHFMTSRLCSYLDLASVQYDILLCDRTHARNLIAGNQTGSRMDQRPGCPEGEPEEKTRLGANAFCSSARRVGTSYGQRHGGHGMAFPRRSTGRGSQASSAGCGLSFLLTVTVRSTIRNRDPAHRTRCGNRDSVAG